MKRCWLANELEEFWSLTSGEMKPLKGRTDSHRLGFVRLLKCFQIEGYFPRDHGDIACEVVKYLGTLLTRQSRVLSDLT